MDDHKLLREVTARREAEAPERAEVYEEISRSRLGNIIFKKLQTAFVGSLSRFENYFGHIWGHGLEPEELNEEQKVYRAIWQECRDEILNNGNNQARGLRDELPQYTVRWDRYQKNFSVNEAGVLTERQDSNG